MIPNGLRVGLEGGIEIVDDLISKVEIDYITFDLKPYESFVVYINETLKRNLTFIIVLRPIKT